jgi:hypothetical protein
MITFYDNMHTFIYDILHLSRFKLFFPCKWIFLSSWSRARSWPSDLEFRQILKDCYRNDIWLSSTNIVQVYWFDYNNGGDRHQRKSVLLDSLVRFLNNMIHIPHTIYVIGWCFPVFIAYIFVNSTLLNICPSFIIMIIIITCVFVLWL